ncbi:epoxide hydrolase [Kribbella sp. ALI-6-A]|uniref:epoxide hydrolase family protein n=1 Tax=Kribbella sp. ALI-6-A TaxID=1933817 RepID=UPI00097C36D3|nr:epoxide hydrolase family protein [Kribbella sp. ALI-6-A]ONI74057.1 epoxide hydrolase [Kribbella sp. ALI-6-A]
MTETTPNRRPEPFTIDVAQDVLDDLRNRLKATRFAQDLDNEDEYYGLSTAYLKPLVEYWATDFDWRAVEKEFNSFARYRVELGGTPIQFIHEPGKGPNPVPLLLLHGWPWPPQSYHAMIGPLTDPAAYGGDPADAFDVVVADLPGFAHSTPVGRGDLNYWKMADLFHELMTDVLGYEKFAVGGADYGALVTTQLGHKYAKNLYGVHLGHEMTPGIFQNDRFWDLTGGAAVPTEPGRLRDDVLHMNETLVSHVAVHMLDAQSITHGFNDSPAGMLAWLVRKWKTWSDRWGDFEKVFPRDAILGAATVYWVNQALGSSIRVYRNSVRHPWQPSHDRQPLIEVPAGFTFLVGDTFPPGVRTPAERIAAFENGPTRSAFNAVNVNAHSDGGHFGPYENPEAWIGDLRNTFRPLR